MVILLFTHKMRFYELIYNKYSLNATRLMRCGGTAAPCPYGGYAGPGGSDTAGDTHHKVTKDTKFKGRGFKGSLFGEDFWTATQQNYGINRMYVLCLSFKL